MLPIGDWQFWMVTAIAIAAIVLIVRPLLPSRKQRDSCGHCPSGAASARKKRTKVKLTVEQKHL